MINDTLTLRYVNNVSRQLNKQQNVFIHQESISVINFYLIFVTMTVWTTHCSYNFPSTFFVYLHFKTIHYFLMCSNNTKSRSNAQIKAQENDNRTLVWHSRISSLLFGYTRRHEMNLLSAPKISNSKKVIRVGNNSKVQ